MVDETGHVWATEDNKYLWVFHGLTLLTKLKIDLRTLFKYSEKSQIELYPWIRGRVVIFDKISGMGAIYYQFKRLLRFREFIDWTYSISITKERKDIYAIVAGYQSNRTIKYDVLKRKVEAKGKYLSY